MKDPDKYRGCLIGGAAGITGPWQSMAALCYFDWYRTQTENYPIDIEHSYSWFRLLNVLEVFRRRAPGTTYLAAASKLESGDPDKTHNQSKGCGSVMRIALAGLYFGERDKEEEIDRLGVDIAAVTHVQEFGYIPAAALIHICGIM